MSRTDAGPVCAESACTVDRSGAAAIYRSVHRLIVDRDFSTAPWLAFDDHPLKICSVGDVWPAHTSGSATLVTPVQAQSDGLFEGLLAQLPDPGRLPGACSYRSPTPTNRHGLVRSWQAGVHVYIGPVTRTLKSVAVSSSEWETMPGIPRARSS